jgi:environmental stress-induced protein Ves
VPPHRGKTPAGSRARGGGHIIHFPQGSQHMIIRLQDCPPRPWKNGLGRTREIVVQPSADGSAEFLWRVSVAEVDSAAPFSAFPGVDRTIVLLGGAGFTMTLDGKREHALTTPFEPFDFPGEAGVTVALAGGPTRDFNLMVRRVHARSDLQVWHWPKTRMTDKATVLVFCARGMIDTAEGCLHAGDAWRPAAPAAVPMSLREGALALVARIMPHRA